MELVARTAAVADIMKWRDLFRHEMNCQIVHDSIHSRPGWTDAYMLLIDGTMVGYGLVAVAGPWKGKPTIFEFYVLPDFRWRVFDLFTALQAASRAEWIETQTNEPFLAIMLLAFGQIHECEKILFHDRLTTSLPANGAVFRQFVPEDVATIAAPQLDADAEWLLEHDGTTVATGGILYHYNRPYGDIFMRVAEGYRRRGFGSYLVQELKRVCYDGGSVPAARCNPANVASWKTLQRAGFVPCGIILVGKVEPRAQ